jgi:hypothetical protein
VLTCGHCGKPAAHAQISAWSRWQETGIDAMDIGYFLKLMA